MKKHIYISFFALFFSVSYSFSQSKTEQNANKTTVTFERLKELADITPLCNEFDQDIVIVNFDIEYLRKGDIVTEHVNSYILPTTIKKTLIEDHKNKTFFTLKDIVIKKHDGTVSKLKDLIVQVN